MIGMRLFWLSYTEFNLNCVNYVCMILKLWHSSNLHLIFILSSSSNNVLLITAAYGASGYFKWKQVISY